MINVTTRAIQREIAEREALVYWLTRIVEEWADPWGPTELAAVAGAQKLLAELGVDPSEVLKKGPP